MEAAVRQRLQNKFINHHPDDPYPLPNIFEVARFVLACTEPAPSAFAPPPPATNPTVASFASAPATDPAAAQLDALIDAVASLGQLFSATLPQLAGALPSNATTPSVSSAPSSYVCSFCSESGHFTRECEAVTAYAKVGKCKRNAEGKIVLPSGAMVPRWITGACLRDRMEEWHRRNPGQEAATSLFLSLAPGPGIIHLPEPLRSSDLSQNSSRSRSASALCAQNDPPSYGAQIAQERLHPTQRPITNPDATTALPQPTTSACEKRVQFVDTYPPTILPQPAAAPFPRARQDSNPQVTEEVHERAWEAPVAISQRELLAFSPEVRVCVADVTTTCRQQQIHTMQCDTADDAPKVTTDNYRYEDMALRFKEAREATKALWDWQETGTARSAERAEHDTLGGAPGSKSLATPLSAGTRAIFLAQAFKPSMNKDTPLACRAPAAACDTNTASDLERGAPVLTTSDIAGALLTAGDAKSLDSSISPSTGAIKPRAQASSAVNTARGKSAQGQGTPGDVLNDFSLADTFISQPPPLVPVSSSKRTAPYTRQDTANASMPAFAAGMPSLFHHIFRLSPLRKLLLPFRGVQVPES